MPFEIVRNDITNMQVDAIVNTANPKPIVGYGADAGIHKKAGPNLLKARQKIGSIALGQAAITPAFELDAKYVIHAVGPVWQGGDHNEEILLGQCYQRALELAKANHCESIAFPLLSAGNHGFPKPLALQIAIREFSAFLPNNDMQIYLVVFSRNALALSEKLFHSVACYIDETYIKEKIIDEYGTANKRSIREAQIAQISRDLEPQKISPKKENPPALSGDKAAYNSDMISSMPSSSEWKKWESLLEGIDAGFAETLLRLIDRTGKKDAEVYKKANIDRKLFSKIRNNMDYRPSKTTAVAFALALELDLKETKDFIGRAGYAHTHSSRFDIIVEYFILRKNYDIFELNEVLFAFDQPLIGT